MSFATLLDLPQQREQMQDLAIEAVKTWLKKRKYWLLIFDNADNPRTIETVMDSLLPTPCSGHVIFTTRLQATGPIQKIEVEPMPLGDATQFFLRRAKLVTANGPSLIDTSNLYKQAREIAQRLYGLPLALDQAAAYIEETKCSFLEYLGYLQTQPLQLLEERGQYAVGHPEPVTTTWFISFDAIAKQSPAAIELLSLLALLEPDTIKEELILEALQDHGRVHQSMQTRSSEARLVLRELLKYSFIRQDAHTNMYIIHRLVQLLVRERLDEDKQKLYAERAVQAVNRVFPNVEVDSWERCQQYLPQVQVCADLISRYHLASPEAARLLNQAGYYLYKRGRYNEAVPFLQRALEISEQVCGAEHPSTATCLSDLALLYQIQGKYEQAEPLFLRALAIREKVLGPEHPATATSLNNLAGLFDEQGKYEQAEPLYQRTLTIREKVLGPEHPDVASILNNLAVLYGNQGKYEEAERFSHRDLAIKEKVLGAEHPDIAESLHNLAGFYNTEGKYEQAEPLYHRALAIFEKVLGPEHSYTAFALDNLAGLYTEQGKYELAERLSQRALAVKEKVLGEQHPDVSQSLITLALIHQKQGNYKQAEPLYQRAVMIYETALGPEHPFTAGGLTYLAILYTEQGKYEQAERLSLRALKIKEQTLGREHSSTAVSLNNLAEIYHASREYEQAEALCLRALAIREKALSPQHPDIAASLTTLAKIYRDEGKDQEAEELSQRASATYRQSQESH